MSGEKAFTSVLQSQSDMNNPDYRKYLEQRQALEGSYPEAVLAPLARPAIGLVRAATQPMTTLYRAEAPSIANPKVSEWMRSTPEYKATVDATGRWFTDDLAEAKWYLDDVQKGGSLYKVKIPSKEAEQMRISKLPEGHPAKEFSRRQDKEFFVPREIAENKELYK